MPLFFRILSPHLEIKGGEGENLWAEIRQQRKKEKERGIE